MGLNNVAVQWPRTGRFYEPVAAEEFADFTEIAEKVAVATTPAAQLARRIGTDASVEVSGYTQLIDLLLGLPGVLYATDAAAEDEDPVIDPDGCAWIAGGLERFIAAHDPYGDEVTFDTVSEVMRHAVSSGRLADSASAWLEQRLAKLHDTDGNPPSWRYGRIELAVLARFYRVCADRGFAVFADA